MNIRPGVSILSVLRHLNYKPWYAVAEFVDNSVQSFLNYEQALRAIGVERATVTIELDAEGSQVTVRDNAAGIHEAEYARAFRAAEVPPDRSGLAEFGMGMKSASCWFAPRWTVRTSALGEAIERSIAFDIARIVHDEIEELDIRVRDVPAEGHYTEIVLSDLYHPLHGRTIGKIKDHLGSIYRIFLRRDQLELTFDGERLAFEDPAVLEAPFFKEVGGEPRRWLKAIDIDFGGEQRVHGFAALRERASTAEAGFALFRRDRLIQGSRDEGYRPGSIFGASNSYRYQRLFGELHLEGFEVSHTKDGFQWEEHEEIVLEALKAELDAEPLPLLAQAEGFRSRVRREDVLTGAQVAVSRTGAAVAQYGAAVLDEQLQEETESETIAEGLPTAELASHRTIEVQLEDERWLVELELSTDPGVGDWVHMSEQPTAASLDGSRRIGIRVALTHPFMERFAGPDVSQIEPLLRVAVALVLAEVTARESGVNLAGSIRRRLNQLLREALSHP